MQKFSKIHVISKKILKNARNSPKTQKNHSTFVIFETSEMIDF